MGQSGIFVNEFQLKHFTHFVTLFCGHSCALCAGCFDVINTASYCHTMKTNHSKINAEFNKTKFIGENWWPENVEANLCDKVHINICEFVSQSWELIFNNALSLRKCTKIATAWKCRRINVDSHEKHKLFRADRNAEWIVDASRKQTEIDDDARDGIKIGAHEMYSLTVAIL